VLVKGRPVQAAAAQQWPLLYTHDAPHGGRPSQASAARALRDTVASGHLLGAMLSAVWRDAAVCSLARCHLTGCGKPDKKPGTGHRVQCPRRQPRASTPLSAPSSPEQEEIRQDVGVQSPSRQCSSGARWLCAPLTQCRPPCRRGRCVAESRVPRRHAPVWWSLPRGAVAVGVWRRPSGRLAVCGGREANPLLPTGLVSTAHSLWEPSPENPPRGGCSWVGPSRR